jgi:hypothetical protein
MRLSCHAFERNAVRLALFVLAYNLGNFLRRLVLQMAEVAIPRDLFGQILTRIRQLSPVPT